MGSLQKLSGCMASSSAWLWLPQPRARARACARHTPEAERLALPEHPLGTLSAIALLEIGAGRAQRFCSEESWQFGKYRFFARVEECSSSSGSFSRPWPGLLFAMRNLVGARA